LFSGFLTTSEINDYREIFTRDSVKGKKRPKGQKNRSCGW
jgi:hypothetical protein